MSAPEHPPEHLQDPVAALAAPLAATIRADFGAFADVLCGVLHEEFRKAYVAGVEAGYHQRRNEETIRDALRRERTLKRGDG